MDDVDEVDDPDEDEPWLENPVMGAEELLRFSRCPSTPSVVDCHGKTKRDPVCEEQASGWYYYLEDKIHFPLQAKWQSASPPEQSRRCEWADL